MTDSDISPHELADVIATSWTIQAGGGDLQRAAMKFEIHGDKEQQLKWMSWRHPLQVYPVSRSG